jgi:hypothetical protein
MILEVYSTIPKWAHSIVDLKEILNSNDIQRGLAFTGVGTGQALTISHGSVQELLKINISLAQSLRSLETHLQHQRESSQTRLLSLRALERQWQAKQVKQDNALQEFSPPALYQRLNAAVSEQESLCRSIEDSFLDSNSALMGDAGAIRNEREVSDFVRSYKENRKLFYIRKEHKQRWDEGRVGGWR